MKAQARDEIFQLLLNSYDELQALDVALGSFGLRWQGVETPDEVNDAPKTMSGKFWVRSLTQVLLSRQTAHMMTDEPFGSPACWRTTGQLIIQVFAPRSVVNSYNIGDLLANEIAFVYRNVETGSGVWFKNATSSEVVPEASFWRWNVSVEFEYDERN